MQNEDRIRQRAHELWEKEGKPEGRHVAHWEQACRECEEEDARTENTTAASDMGNLTTAAAELRDGNQGAAEVCEADLQRESQESMETVPVSTSS